jgi:hypothetical protein
MTIIIIAMMHRATGIIYTSVSNISSEVKLTENVLQKLSKALQ